MARALSIGMVAGETSGDNLATPLIQEIKKREPDVRFRGIGGPGMINEGFESLFDMERLSVNAFIDPIKRLPELIKMLTTLRRSFLDSPPDVFVGIDSNVFNLLLEGMLRKRGIKTVHYVSPTVWAWRRRRIKKIGRSVDLMLTLYPFETHIYEANDIRVAFVGHPKADEIPLECDKSASRRRLGLADTDRVVAILPGSRGSEIKYSGRDFLLAARLMAEQSPDLKFVIPSANPIIKKQIEQLANELCAGIDVTITDGNSETAMCSADVVLVNSGTATLEALLLKRPMVMSYRLGALTYAVVSRMTTTEFFALPNILAGRKLIPEIMQDEATPERLATEVMALIDNPIDESLMAEFERIHLGLKSNSGKLAADAVLQLIDRRSG